MRKSGSRVLAGLASVAIGGVFVAASALGALADSPSPTAPLTVGVTGHTVTVSGTLDWSGKCSGAKAATGAGFGVVWNDTGDPGLPVPGDSTKLVGLTGLNGSESDGNLVHAASATCGFSLTHTYVNFPPTEVCVVGYHYDSTKTTGFHSKFEGGPDGDTDNSITEPSKGGQPIVCSQVVAPKSDVELKESGAPTPVAPGSSVTWTVNVDNLPNVAKTTQTQLLKVNVDNNQTITSVNTGSWTNCHRTTTQLTCEWPGILGSPGKADDVTVTATVLDNGESKVTSTAHVDNGNNSDDLNPNNQDGSASLDVTGPQTIGIDKTATQKVNVGDTITYTMVVTNKSTSPTTDTIKVTDAIPATVSFLDTNTTDNRWSCNNQQNLSCTWNGPALTAAGTAGDHTGTIVVHATALEAAVPSVTNTAHAIEGNIDVQDSATTIVNTPVNLILTKSADPASGSDVLRGQTIEYTLHYGNTGTLAANGVDITDPIPDGTTFVDGSGGCSTSCKVTFDGDDVNFHLDIAPNSSGDAHFSVTVNQSDVDQQVITNQATLAFNGSVIFSNKTHHQVHVPSGDLVITKAVSYTKPATVNSLLTYTLTAVASGNIDQTNVVITDRIPDGTTLKSDTVKCSTGCQSEISGANNNGTVFWHVGTMHPGDSVSVTFGVTVNGPDAAGTIPTEIDNVGDIQSNETPLTPSNKVIVPLTPTTVLGTKIVKTPTATTLPFTGLNSLQDALLAAVLIGGGMLLLTWPRLSRRQTGTV